MKWSRLQSLKGDITQEETFHNDQIAQGWYHTRITSCKSSVLIGTTTTAQLLLLSSINFGIQLDLSTTSIFL